MKKVYKIIGVLLVLEYFCLSLMNKLDIHIQSWVGNAVGALLFLMPILLLLYFMKKDEDISEIYRIIARFFFWFLIFCYVAGSIGKAIELNSNEFIQKDSQYVLTPNTCKTFFGCDPAGASEVLENSYWVEGHYQSAIEDETGNLLLTLSEEDKEHWKNYINQLIQKRIELDASEGYQYIVGDDYKSIESHTTREVYLADGFNIIYITAYCGLMQMLNGEDVNNWYVDVKMVDLDTGIVIAEAKIPEETVKVDDEDWDKIEGTKR